MPAPTALQRAPDELAEAQIHSTGETAIRDEGLAVTIPNASTTNKSTPTKSSQKSNGDTEAMHIDSEGRPAFAPERASKQLPRIEQRSIAVPPHRMTPLKAAWPKIYPPLVEHLKLQTRMNVRKKAVELRTSKFTDDAGTALQKGDDFVRAFVLGFDVDDAIALLRLDDLYLQTFEIKDVKNLQGEHLSRAIGRIAGKDGKTRFAIENASKTRVVLADQKIHILGGFKNIHIAREAIVSLILGAPPGKVYGNLRTVAARMKERF